MAEKVTLAAIAEACHLSVGTVSRALNDRSDIAAETKERVARTARELGYKKGSGTTCRPLQIGVVTCRKQESFHDEVTRGIRNAEADFGVRRVSVDLLQTEYLDQPSQAKLLAELHPEDYDALIINSAGVETAGYIDRFAEQGIPVSTFNTDAPASRRLFFTGCSAHRSGQMGAYLLGKLVGGRGKVILFGSIAGKTAWVDRLSSAYAVLQQEFPEIEIVPVLQDPQTKRDVTDSMRECLEANADLDGIFLINNALTCDAIRLLRGQDRRGVRMVGFDISPATKKGVLDGYCDALLFQDPFRQGYASLTGMVKYLTEGILPATEEISITPRIVMKYNMDSY